MLWRYLFRTRLLLVVVITWGFVFADKLLAPPPPRVTVPSSFPGTVVGSASSRWVGPYVLQTTVAIDSITAKNTITWFSSQGKVMKEITSQKIGFGSEYIMDRKADTTLILSLYDTCTLTIPPHKSDLGGEIRGRDYGKYFYWERKTDSGTYTDYYARGRFIGTFGPHCGRTGPYFDVSRTGSIAFTVEASTTDSLCKIISIDSLGQKVFSFKADGRLSELRASPSGRSVVIRYNGFKVIKDKSYRYACFFADHSPIRIDLQPNGFLIDWVPNSEKMIVSTSIEDYTYSLLDWKSGKLLWSISNPLEYTPGINYYAAAISERYFILSGMAIRQSIPHGPVIPNDLRGTIRMLAAIDIQKGKLVAKWYEPTFSGRWQIGQDFPPMPDRGGRLIWYHGDLYHVTEVNFSKIDFGDIDSLRNGWVGPSDSGAACSDVGL